MAQANSTTQIASPAVSNLDPSDIATSVSGNEVNIDINPSGSHGDSTKFNDLINDMVFNVWKCQNCLSMVHFTNACTSRVRCRSCFRLGHMEKGCSDSSPSPSYKWVPLCKSDESNWST